jgi:hypothetical protein
MDTTVFNTSCCCFTASVAHTIWTVTALRGLGTSSISLLRCDLRSNAPISLRQCSERGYVQWHRKDIWRDGGQICQPDGNEAIRTRHDLYLTGENEAPFVFDVQERKGLVVEGVTWIGDGYRFRLRNLLAD